MCSEWLIGFESGVLSFQVPEYKEDIRYIHHTEYVDVPKEIVERVPKIERVIVEKWIDVPGEVINQWMMHALIYLQKDELEH